MKQKFKIQHSKIKIAIALVVAIVTAWGGAYLRTAIPKKHDSRDAIHRVHSVHRVRRVPRVHAAATIQNPTSPIPNYAPGRVDRQ